MSLRGIRICLRKRGAWCRIAVVIVMVLIVIKYNMKVTPSSNRASSEDSTDHYIIRKSDKQVEMSERVKRLEDFCSSLGLSLENTKAPSSKKKLMPVYTRTILDTTNKLQYCPVWKAGSTYWKRVFYIKIRTKMETVDPYSVNIEDVMGDKVLKAMTMTNQGLDKAATAKMNLTKFLFVRDPYVKLFSLYVDKLYSPNPFYWSAIGTQIVQMLRGPQFRTESDCGHDITFEEVIIFVYKATNHGFSFDEHLKSNYDSCRPCDMHYDIIGKMETFEEDVEYVFKNSKLVGFTGSLETLSTRAEEDSIHDSIEATFSERKSVTKCIPFSSALKRTWRKLQIKGLLPITSAFPLTDSKANIINKAADFENIVLREYKKHKLKLERHSNQKEALTQAFHSVGRRHLRELEKVLRYDFKLFDYNPKPSYIYGGKSTVEFDFFSFE